MRIVSRVIAFFRDGHHDRELDEELDTHRALLVDSYRRRGLSDAEAERAARVALGSAAQLRDAHRDVRGLPLADTFVRDFRYALRGCRRQPGFTAIAVLTLAIGIGANAAVFSVVHAVLMQPLPYSDPDALVSVTRSRTGIFWISLRRWEAMREARSFDAGVYRPAPEDVILAGRNPEALRGARMSANVLDILGVRPMVGRAFRSDEDVDGAPPVALISERLWARRFARSRSIIGTSITMNSAPFTIIGVLPATFQFPLREIDIWFPRPSAAAFLEPQFQACCAPLLGIARLRNGFTREQAAAELSVLNQRYESGTRRVDAGPAGLTPLKDDLVGRVDTMLWMLMAAVGFVLLIACANVATLLMARATSRTREFAIRAALGAERWRVLQQLVTESLVLTAVGGGLGLALATGGVHAVATMRLVDLPRAGEIAVNGTVLLWTIGVACATALLFGTFPSLQLLRPNVMDRLRQSGASTPDSPRRYRLVGVGTRGALAIVQVALSLILLIGAGLMTQTLARLSRVDLGFPSAGLLTMRVPLPVATYNSVDKRAAFFEQLVQRVNGLPGVRGATVVRAMPTTRGLAMNFQIDSQRIPDPGHVEQWVQTVTPGYFEAIRLPLKRGRTFEPRDNKRGAPPVAVVNERFARKYWPSYPSVSAPLGERLFLPVISTKSLIEIVGVVADVRHDGLTKEPSPQIYVPDRLYSAQNAFLALRTDGNSLGTIEAVRAEVRALDPNQSVTDINTMDDLLERSAGQQHLTARVLGAFAAIALALALIGLYGVLSYSVTQRTQEIGIRRVLGAGHREVIWIVLGLSLRVTLVGLGLGLAGAYAWTNLLKSLLFDVSATDGVTFLGAPVAFVAVALLASLPPVWRASRVDPTVILRSE
jgi:predicted permease